MLFDVSPLFTKFKETVDTGDRFVNGITVHYWARIASTIQFVISSCVRIEQDSGLLLFFIRK